MTRRPDRLRLRPAVGRPGHDQPREDLSHFGFALGSRAEVDAMPNVAARRPPRLGAKAFSLSGGISLRLKDPDGYVIEFSYGQPLARRRLSLRRAHGWARHSSGVRFTFRHPAMPHWNAWRGCPGVNSRSLSNRSPISSMADSGSMNGGHP